MRNKRARPGEGVPADVKVKEGQALHALWKQRKRRTQAEFAADLGFTQGYIPQFFSGIRPLTLELAIRFAAELDVDIVKFSPRLAEAFSKHLQETAWPFQSFSRAEYESLNPAQRAAVESLVGSFLAANGALPTRRIRRVV